MIGLKLNKNGSHWDNDVVKGDFMMSGSTQRETLYSNFTFALLEDSGWYKPTYKNVDKFEWGKN